MNGSENEPNPNDYRCPVTETSKHTEFWKEAKEKLMRMAYVDKKDLKSCNAVKIIKNWILTIEGFEKLWVELKEAGSLHFKRSLQIRIY